MIQKVIKENKYFICYKINKQEKEYFVKKLKVVDNIYRPFKIMKGVFKIYKEKRNLDILQSKLGYRKWALSYLNKKTDVTKIIFPFVEGNLFYHKMIERQIVESASPKYRSVGKTKLFAIKLYDIAFFFVRTVKYLINGNLSLRDDFKQIIEKYRLLLKLLRFNSTFTIHGDFHPGNLIVAKKNKLKVIDWEASFDTVAFIAYDFVRYDHHPESKNQLIVEDSYLISNQIDILRYRDSYELCKYLEVKRRGKQILNK